MSFIPPPHSSGPLSGIDFAATVPVGFELKALFDQHDASAAGRADPSKVKVILQMTGNTLFVSSKLAVDADGAAAFAGRRRGTDLDPADGQNDTSWHFPTGEALSSERHPYFVLPGGAFRDTLGVALGDLAAIVYRDRITAAIAGDIGPEHKFGEGSIRLHEAFMPDAPDPCIRDRDGTCRRIHDVSIEQDVLFFIFAGSAFHRGELTPDNAEALIKQRAYALFRLLAPASIGEQADAPAGA